MKVRVQIQRAIFSRAIQDSASSLWIGYRSAHRQYKKPTRRRTASNKRALRDLKTGTGFAAAKLSEILPAARCCSLRQDDTQALALLAPSGGQHSARSAQDDKYRRPSLLPAARIRRRSRP